MSERFFVRRAVYVRATVWEKHGDHPRVLKGPLIKLDFIMLTTNGFEPSFSKQEIPDTHGWLSTGDGAVLVEPGDIVMRGALGTDDEYIVAKPDLFHTMFREYEVIEAEIIH